jgi:hypothetical protein
MPEVANLEFEDGTYSIKDKTARQQVQNIINNNLPNKASARIWNVVTDGGADPTGSASAQSVFNRISTILNTYDYVYIPKGTYNLTSLFICSERVICDCQTIEENPNSKILAVKEIPTVYPSFKLLKQTEKPSDGYSFQGWCYQNDGDDYTSNVLAINRNSSTNKLVLKRYNNLLNLENSEEKPWGHGNSLTYMPSLTANGKNQVYMVCPINANNLIMYDASTGTNNTVPVNGVSSQINIANKIGKSPHIIVQTEDNKIHVCRCSGSGLDVSFTSVYSISISRPVIQARKLGGLNGLAYFKGNIFTLWSDNTSSGYDFVRNAIRVDKVSGGLLYQYLCNPTYEAKEFEGLNVTGNTIKMLEYGNNSVFTDYNSWSLWEINPYDSGLSDKSSELEFNGMLGEQRIRVNNINANWGKGTSDSPFRYLQFAISYASSFQPVHIQGPPTSTAVASEEIHIKNRAHYLKITNVRFNDKVTVENCANVQFENCVFNFTGDYQITIDGSNVDFSGCTATMTGGQSGNGWIRAVGNSSVELHNSCKVTARNAASLSRGAKFSFGKDTTGTVYNCIYNEGSVSLGNVSKITHTYKSSVSNGGLDGIVES